MAYQCTSLSHFIDNHITIVDWEIAHISVLRISVVPHPLYNICSPGISYSLTYRRKSKFKHARQTHQKAKHKQSSRQHDYQATISNNLSFIHEFFDW